MKKHLAFIDHSYHRKTRATGFLIDLLREQYDITFFWDESWNGGDPVDIASIGKKDFQIVIFFQIIHYPEGELFHLREKEVIVCPMYDASPHHSPHYWDKFKIIPNMKFINFSKILHNLLNQKGFSSFYIQYFPPPSEAAVLENHHSSLHGFFWQRTNQITWRDIKKLIKNSSFKSFHLHSVTDPPGFRFIKPSSKEIAEQSIRISQWFDDKNQLMDVIKRSNVFFASRLNEGIGQSFIEAMSMGKCVVAPDRPTMNEYIRHGETGLLYNPLQPRPINLTEFLTIGQNARRYIEEGFADWNRKKHQILEFINSESAQLVKGSAEKKSLGWKAFLAMWVFRAKGQIKRKFPKLVKLIYLARKRYR